MDGAPSGKSGTGTIEIKVIDINDNVPTLEKDEVVLQIVYIYSICVCLGFAGKYLSMSGAVHG